MWPQRFTLPFPWSHLAAPPDDGELRTCGWVRRVLTFGVEEYFQHAPRCTCPPDQREAKG